jgi:hypothetical protein
MITAEDQAAPGVPGYTLPLPTAHARDGRSSAGAELSAGVAGRLRVLAQWWGSRPAATRDCVLALVFTVLSFAEPLSRVGAQIGDLPDHGASVASVLLPLGQTLPLAVRTRWPAACLAVAGVSFAVHESLGYPPSFGSLGLYVALYSVGAHQGRSGASCRWRRRAGTWSSASSCSHWDHPWA